jgi:hypothetical protein
MTLHKVMRLPLVLALALSCSQVAGCSFLFSNAPPPDDQREAYFDCSGYAEPVIDTVWAGLNGLGTLVAAGTSQADWNSKPEFGSRSATIASGLIWLGLFGASAIYGYSNAQKCSEAKDERMNRRIFVTRPSWPPSSRPTYPPQSLTRAQADPSSASSAPADPNPSETVPTSAQE